MNEEIRLLATSMRRTTMAKPATIAFAENIWLTVSVGLLAIGTIARLWPVIKPELLFWQFMSEDGFLMQTVARNVALGRGLSVSDGTVATNGVQPLATFLFAGAHALNPLAIRHTMNGLESGLHVLATMLALLYYLRSASRRKRFQVAPARHIMFCVRFLCTD